MIKKLMVLMMVFNLLFVNAYASSQTGLKAAFDEMNYALTVEWDQKDQSFYDEQIKKFKEVVQKLQKEGVTNSQMIEFAMSEAKNAKAAKDLETAFSMITINKMSSEEATKYMMESMKRSYSTGASWNSDVESVLYIGILIVIVAVGASYKAKVPEGTGNWTGGDGEYCYYDCFYRDIYCGNGSLRGEFCESELSCDRICR